MTLPTEYPSGFNGTANDFNKAKVDRSGTLRSYPFLVTTSTAILTSGTVIGLVPVRKGARLHIPGCAIQSDDLDTGNSVTASIGIVYNDTVNNTSVPTKYASALSTLIQSAAGAPVTLISTDAANEYIATGDGWVAITTAAASTTTQGTIWGALSIAYDQA